MVAITVVVQTTTVNPASPVVHQVWVMYTYIVPSWTKYAVDIIPRVQVQYLKNKQKNHYISASTVPGSWVGTVRIANDTQGIKLCGYSCIIHIAYTAIWKFVIKKTATQDGYFCSYNNTSHTFYSDTFLVHMNYILYGYGEQNGYFIGLQDTASLSSEVQI